MISDDIMKLCQEALGQDQDDSVEKVADGARDGVVEKVGAAGASVSEGLIDTIDQALGSEEQGDIGGHESQGKVAIAMLFAAGDIMAQGRG